MNGNASTAVDTTNLSGSTSSPAGKDWSTTLKAFNFVNIVQLVIIIWVLLCMIVYGFKTKRWWKKAGTSSLNSGMIYTTCTVAVALSVPKLVTSILLIIVPRMENPPITCEILSHVDSAVFTVATYATYFFLWLRQRVIYRHPYVKQSISTCAHWISKLFVVPLTAAATALLVIFVTVGTYTKEKDYCVTYHPEGNSKSARSIMRRAILASALISSHALLLCLATYPAVVVKFDASEGQITTVHRTKSVFRTCLAVTGIKPNGPSSPIELSVRRMILTTAIMTVSDILTKVLALAIFSPTAPLALRQTVYDFGGFVNVFCMLANFGFYGQVLTLFCPTCKTRKLLRRTKRAETGTTENASPVVDIG